MKETPLLFQAPMVLAAVAGTKWQTRRIVKWRDVAPGLNLSFSGLHARQHHDGWVLESQTRTSWEDRCRPTPCPYGQAGDRLWVKETFFAFGRWETRFSQKKGRDEWHFIDMTLECGHTYSYAANGGQPVPMRGKRDAGVTPGWWKRPAIFMPRAASRITLEITEVRVERLQAISEEDAIAEGIEADRQPNDSAPLWRNYKTGNTTICPRYSYESLWCSINGHGAWDANPWVWRLSFKRVDQ